MTCMAFQAFTGCCASGNHGQLSGATLAVEHLLDGLISQDQLAGPLLPRPPSPGCIPETWSERVFHEENRALFPETVRAAHRYVERLWQRLSRIVPPRPATATASHLRAREHCSESWPVRLHESRETVSRWECHDTSRPHPRGSFDSLETGRWPTQRLAACVCRSDRSHTLPGCATLSGVA